MKFKYIFFIIIIFIFTSCYKKKNNQLAKNYYEQSLVEAEEKNFKKALQLVDKSLSESPTPQAYALKATLFYQINEFQESVSLFKKIIRDKETPSTMKADIMNNYSCALLALGKKEEAKDNWKILTKDKNYLSPEVAWFNLGLLEFYEASEKGFIPELAKDKLLNALRNFTNAISIATEYIDAYFYLGLTYLKLKDYAKAKEVVINLITKEPKHEAANLLLDEINKEIANRYQN